MNVGPGDPVSPTGVRTRYTALLLAVIAIAILPLAWRGTSCGQDFDFHLQNWLELSQAWHHGLFYPWWAASPNYGAGEPRFVFYPPFSRFLGALLGSILPWSWTPLTFSMACLLGAGFSLRAMAREWLPEDSATLAACVYVINPYMLFLLYERGALAELLAASWIPLLVLFALRRAPSLVPLALVFATLWLTNAPSGVMGSYMLAIIVLVAAFRKGNARLVARAACAIPLGLALAGFWLIPAIYQQRWVEIGRATGPLMRVQDSFPFHFVSLAGVPSEERFDTIYHNHVLRHASWVAAALIGFLIVAAILSRKRFSCGDRLSPWLPLAVVAAILIALQFPISGIVWRMAPELLYLQFPWRWMLVLGMIFAIFAGAAFPRAASRRAVVIRGLIVLLLACGMAALSSSFWWQSCDDPDNLSAQIAALHQGGFEGTDEYTPQPADNSLIQQGLPFVRILESPDADTAPTGDNPTWSPDPGAVVPAHIDIEGRQVQHDIVRITTSRPAWAVFRLMEYPAWRITRNGAEIRDMHRTDGLIAIPLEPGSNRIEIRWHVTRDQQAGLALSLSGLAITLALAFTSRSKARKVPLP